MTLTKPQWRDSVEIWENPQPIEADQLALWRNAVSQIGDYRHIECRYKRYTAPCEDCESPYPRVYIEAAENSLTVSGYPCTGFVVRHPRDARYQILERGAVRFHESSPVGTLDDE